MSRFYLSIIFYGFALTIMEGSLPDQAALHGILAHIRDWSLPLYLVQRQEDGLPANQQQEIEVM